MELDWVKYSEVADRFQHKARFEDRDDLRHNIILRLAEVASNNGHEPFTIGAMIRVASYVVMEYWHSEKRNGKVISLNTDIGNGDGDSMELMDTIADDNALNLEAWVDARTWLMGCPNRLIQIANKRVSGIALEPSEKMYLGRFRRKEQRPLKSVTF